MRLRSRVTLLAVLGVIALIVTGSITTSRFLEARGAASEVVADLQPAADNVAQLITAIADMDRGIRGYALEPNQTSALAPYAEGRAESALALATLNSLLSNDDKSLMPLVTASYDARSTWLQSAAEPAIKMIRDGNPALAAEFIAGPEDNPVYPQTFALMNVSAAALQDGVDDRRAAEFANLRGFAEQLAIALLVTALILVGGLVASVTFINLWVLRPLDRLRFQLREVAREGMHELPIAPSGPPELAAAGADAEEMRRRLVTEIDEARMAREGLEQEGPVVAAIRAELTRPQVAHAPGLEIFGDLQPAEGVLAGDWWDVITLHDGRTAIMITDVSGHGPQAGIAGLRAKLIQTSVLDSGGTPSEAMLRSAQLFAETPARFATSAIVVLDPNNRSVEWVNAGHLPPLLMTGDGNAIELDITGPLLSALGGTWVSQQRSMSVGDVLFMFTDGVSESRDESGEELNEAGLPQVFRTGIDQAGNQPKDVVPLVLALARQRSIDWRRDDVTLIAARMLEFQPLHDRVQ